MHTATAPSLRPVARPTPRPVRPNPRPLPRSVAVSARSAAVSARSVEVPPAGQRAGAATRPAGPSAARAGRRRAVAVACAAVVALTAIGVGFGVGHAAADSNGVPETPVVYVVQPGDTLWAIAAKVAPGANVARVVDALRSAAGGSSLTPGQRISLPDSLS